MGRVKIVRGIHSPPLPVPPSRCPPRENSFVNQKYRLVFYQFVYVFRIRILGRLREHTHTSSHKSRGQSVVLASSLLFVIFPLSFDAASLGTCILLCSFGTVPVIFKHSLFLKYKKEYHSKGLFPNFLHSSQIEISDFQGRFQIF